MGCHGVNLQINSIKQQIKLEEVHISMQQDTTYHGPLQGDSIMSKYTKGTAVIKNKPEVIYLTDSELERCRNRLGKEGCEDTSLGRVCKIGDISRMNVTDRLSNTKILIMG